MSTFDEEEWMDVTQDGAVAQVQSTPQQPSQTPSQTTTKPVDSETTLPIRQTSTDSPNELLYGNIQWTARTYFRLHPQAPIFHAQLSADIFSAFLGGLPTDEKRQEFNCRTCKHFMRGVGQLALVDPKTGNLIPLFWYADAQSEYWKPAIKAVQDLFVGKKVDKQFKLTEEVREQIGDETRGGKFPHMSFLFPDDMISRKDPVGFSTPNTAALASMLEKVLWDYNAHTVETASTLLNEDKLPYADKHKDALRWLHELIQSDRLTRKQSDISRHNLIHMESSSTYLGCLNTLRSGAASTLLSSVKEGKSFAEIDRAWRAIVDPLSYMRPSAAPKEGNIQAAERLFAELGLSESDLKRTYLTASDIPDTAYLYRQPAETPGKDSTVGTSSPRIFASVKPRNPTTQKDPSPSTLAVPPTSITFTKLVTNILPTARKLEYLVPNKTTFYFLIKGPPGTKPLMQWHNSSNLASWYTHITPQAVKHHGLSAGWVPVTKIVSFPHMWDALALSAPNTLPSDEDMEKFQYKSHGINFLLCLEGIQRDKTMEGSMLFPTFLRRELHGVRSTIERYSNEHDVATLQDGEKGYVGGVGVHRPFKDEDRYTLRVTDERGKVREYKIVLYE